METNEFVSQLKAKYGYSDEMEQFLQKAVPAIISYYGEDKKNIVFEVFSVNKGPALPTAIRATTTHGP